MAINKYGKKQEVVKKVKKDYKLIRTNEGDLQVLQDTYGQGELVSKFGKQYYKVNKK